MNSVFYDNVPLAMSTSETVQTPFVVVRLEGGLGDHILGLRVLPFIRARYPSHDIVVFADCAGQKAPLDVVSMTKNVARVVPVYRSSAPTNLARSNLSLLDSDSLRVMNRADLVVDVHGDLMMVDAAILLDVDLFTLMHARPELNCSHSDIAHADRLLAPYSGATFVGINIAKHGGVFLHRHEPFLVNVLRTLLSRPDVIVLNIFTSSYDYAHWPEPGRSHRSRVALSDATFHCHLCALDDRIVPCVDLPTPVVAGLLSRCGYYVGVDNGLKHLAWALRVPLTFFHPYRPSNQYIFRWMPDVHRMLTFGCPLAQFEERYVSTSRSVSFDCGEDHVVRGHG